MTEPSSARPVPGPPRPGPARPAPAPEQAASGDVPAPEQAAGGVAPVPVDGRFADLEQRPVAEHVAVFEEEHSRLQRELGTIDQL